MALGAFLRRERIISVRRKAAFSERCTGVIATLAVIVACVVASDWMGFDRTSVAGFSRFSLAAFGLSVALQLLFVSGLIATATSASIASERDRKTLDALLATRVSSAEIVLGAVCSGLFRYLNGLLPLIPVVILCQAVDLRLVLLAFAGVTSTACFLAAVAVVVSTRARTAARSIQWAVHLTIAWMWLPMLLLIMLPRAWPAAARWAAPIALPLLDSSPAGVGLGMAGLLPRGSPVDSVLRMIAYQSAASCVLILWAIARLRHASRAVYDAEGRTALRRLLRARWRPRPPCGDDPVLWREIHPRRSSDALLLLGYALNVLWIGLTAYAISWFAIPAFAELLRTGYGVGDAAAPEIHPLARMVVVKLSRFTLAQAAGQARLEFNIILRQATAVVAFVYAILVAGVAAESIVLERERDTWSGLLATPLSGRDILRAKMIGAAWKARVLVYLLLAVWTVGLLAGSVHPLGFLASLLGLAVSTWFLAALGISASLRGGDRNRATGLALGPLLLTMGLSLLPFTMPGTESVLLAVGTMPFELLVSLLSYEDVHAAFRSAVPPQLAAVGIQGHAGVRAVLAAWLASLAAQGVGAWLLSRAASRGFDRAVGRPARAAVIPPESAGCRRRF